MDRVVVERKLEALRHCLQRLRDRRPTDVAALADFDHFAAAVAAHIAATGGPAD